MPPELATAIIGALISAVVAMGAAAALLPRIIQTRLDVWQKAQEAFIKTQQENQDNKLAMEKMAREEAVEKARADREAAAEDRALVKSLVQSTIQTNIGNLVQQETLVKAFTRQTEILDTHAKELKANTNITKEGVEAIGELSEHIEEMLLVGSQPVQLLTKQLDLYRNDVIELGNKQDTVAGKVEAIHQTITDLLSLKITLEAMIRLAELKLVEAKKDTGDMPSANPLPA